MRAGDVVRFAKMEEVCYSQWKDSKKWHLAPKNKIGILVEHDKLMGVVHVLYEGEVLRIRSVFVEKAGKKDFINFKKK